MTAKLLPSNNVKTKQSHCYKLKGVLQSIYPPQSLFGYSHFSFMVPPFRPDNVLMLGYGWGTISKLIHMIWGHSCQVTGVDNRNLINPYPEAGDDVIISDALHFVESLSGQSLYDYIVVDLFDGNQVPDFVFTKEFAARLLELCGDLISVNVLQKDAETLRQVFEARGWKYEKEQLIADNAVVFFSKLKEVE